MSRIKMTTLAFILFELFPLMESDACPFHNLKTVCNIIMILHRYVEQIMMMSHVKE